jgi:hypothetical protein
LFARVDTDAVDKTAIGTASPREVICCQGNGAINFGSRWGLEGGYSAAGSTNLGVGNLGKSPNYEQGKQQEQLAGLPDGLALAFSRGLQCHQH